MRLSILYKIGYVCKIPYGVGGGGSKPILSHPSNWSQINIIVYRKSSGVSLNILSSVYMANE